MSEKPVFLYAAIYDDIADAEADYEAVFELHALGAIGTFDSAVIRKEDDGKVRVTKTEKPTQHGAWTGAGVGALVGLVFPPAIIGSAIVGAGAGGLVGHLRKGISRGDLKDLGDELEAGTAAVIVIGESKIEEQLEKAMARANKLIEKQMDADAEELKREIDAAARDGRGQAVIPLLLSFRGLARALAAVWRDPETKALPVVAARPGPHGFAVLLALRGLDLPRGALLLDRDADDGRVRGLLADHRRNADLHDLLHPHRIRRARRAADVGCAAVLAAEGRSRACASTAESPSAARLVTRGGRIVTAPAETRRTAHLIQETRHVRITQSRKRTGRRPHDASAAAPTDRSPAFARTPGGRRTTWRRRYPGCVTGAVAGRSADSGSAACGPAWSVLRQPARMPCTLAAPRIGSVGVSRCAGCRMKGRV